MDAELPRLRGAPDTRNIQSKQDIHVLRDMNLTCLSKMILEERIKCAIFAIVSIH